MIQKGATTIWERWDGINVVSLPYTPARVCFARLEETILESGKVIDIDADTESCLVGSGEYRLSFGVKE